MSSLTVTLLGILFLARFWWLIHQEEYNTWLACLYLCIGANATVVGLAVILIGWV